MVLLRVPGVPVLTVRFLPVSAAVGAGLLRPAIRPVPALRSLRATAAIRQVPPRRFRGRRLPAAATVRSIRAVRFLRLPLPFIARTVGPETVPIFHRKGSEFRISSSEGATTPSEEKHAERLRRDSGSRGSVLRGSESLEHALARYRIWRSRARRNPIP